MKSVVMMVNCEDDMSVVKVMEILGRAQAGLAIDGFHVMVVVQDPATAEDASPGAGCRYPGPPCT